MSHHPLLALATAGAFFGLASCQNPTPHPTARSITVFPVVLANQPNAQVATVVGSLLERGGMPEVQVGDATFQPDPAQDFQARLAAFTTFVQQHKPSTERALFVDIAGTRKTGIERVQSVLVDADGKVLWSEQQQAGDASFDANQPKEPLDCCVFVAQRLREPLGLADPLRVGAKDGRLGESMKVGAGVPGEAEQKAMADRLTALRKVATTTSIRVLPPRTGKQWSATAAADLAQRLVAAGLAKASAATTAIPFDTKAASNEQVVLWSGAASLQQAVRAGAAGSDYLLATDFLMADENKVGAVHSYLLAPNGDLVWVDYQNSHHDDFRAIEPKTNADCVALVTRRVAAALKP